MIESLDVLREEAADRSAFSLPFLDLPLPLVDRPTVLPCDLLPLRLLHPSLSCVLPCIRHTIPTSNQRGGGNPRRSWRHTQAHRATLHLRLQVSGDRRVPQRGDDVDRCNTAVPWHPTVFLPPFFELSLTLSLPSTGLHCRLIGHASRIRGLRKVRLGACARCLAVAESALACALASAFVGMLPGQCEPAVCVV